MTFQVQWISARVIEVEGPWATVKDSYGIIRQVRVDFRRAGRHPKPGEQWLLDRSLNDWTFAALYSPDDATLDEFSDVNIESPLPGHVITYDGDEWVNAPPGGVESEQLGLIPGDPIYFKTTGVHTFTKANYPGAAAFLIETQGAGGGGGGAALTAATQMSAGGGGGGGGYARSIVLATDLDATEAITVGAGGTSSAGGSGVVGGDSVFDTISGEVRGGGGAGGSTGSAQTTFFHTLGGDGGAGTGDVVFEGGPGVRGSYARIDTNIRGGGEGGNSHLGGGGRPNNSGAGAVGSKYGGGGSGASNGQSVAATAGGVGGAGIVIVTPLYPVTGGVVGVGAPGVGLIPGGTLYFDNNNVFTKSDYIGIKAIVVEAQGGGGGGGGASTNPAGQLSMGSGGGGGGYARSLILVTDLAPSETIIVGNGGAGGAAGANDGIVGGTSSFGSHVIGLGGGGGAGLASVSPGRSSDNPGLGGAGTGQLVVPGNAGILAQSYGSGTAQAMGSAGGGSFLGAGGMGLRSGGSGSSPGQSGQAGRLYGGGGGGAISNATQTQVAGGAGAKGRVMVHLYYASGGEGGSPPSAGWIEGSPIYFKTTGAHTFTKADYPGARAFKIECCGAGGGSGGAAATAAGDAAIGGGGAGGGYARSIVPYDDLAVTEAITVGAGGTAGAGTPTDGGSGGDSVFDTIPGEVRGKGGGGGGAGTSVLPLSGVPGAAGGALSGNVGDFVVTGGDAIQGFSLAATRNYPSGGGTAFLSNTQSRSIVGSGQATAQVGNDFGGGAYGPTNSQSQTALAGAIGGPGIVIVTPLY